MRNAEAKLGNYQVSNGMKRKLGHYNMESVSLPFGMIFASALIVC